jgi:tetraacyldisaccharide 4'-kinase
LIGDADRDGAVLVTTEKDLVRLRGSQFPDRARDIVAFTVTLEFEDEPVLRKFVTDRLFQARQKKFRPEG